MPIHKEEPCVFPENLLAEPAEVPAFEPGDRHWWVVYTKSRQEKAFARELLKYQIPFYLPQIKKTSLVKGRRRTSFAAIFAGYVFLLADEAERVRGLTTNRVSRMLTVEDAEQLVRDLRQIKRLIESDAPLTIERRIAPGQRVRINRARSWAWRAQCSSAAARRGSWSASIFSNKALRLKCKTSCSNGWSNRGNRRQATSESPCFKEDSANGKKDQLRG